MKCLCEGTWWAFPGCFSRLSAFYRHRSFIPQSAPPAGTAGTAKGPVSARTGPRVTLPRACATALQATSALTAASVSARLSRHELTEGEWWRVQILHTAGLPTLPCCISWSAAPRVTLHPALSPWLYSHSMGKSLRDQSSSRFPSFQDVPLVTTARTVHGCAPVGKVLPVTPSPETAFAHQEELVPPVSKVNVTSTRRSWVGADFLT